MISTPYIEIQHIEQSHKCTDFRNIIDAEAFQHLEGGTILKERDKDVWHVIQPEITGNGQIGVPMGED